VLTGKRQHIVDGIEIVVADHAIARGHGDAERSYTRSFGREHSQYLGAYLPVLYVMAYSKTTVACLNREKETCVWAEQSVLLYFIQYLANVLHLSNMQGCREPQFPVYSSCICEHVSSRLKLGMLVA